VSKDFQRGDAEAQRETKPLPQSRYGCVALLDALGTGTASLDQSTAYLNALGDIRTVISEFSMERRDRKQMGRVPEKYSGGEFRVRFFADSILITLPFEREHANWLPIARMFVGLSAIVAVSLSRRILFRGAVAIGDYIESEDAVLGPAVLDAAHWYEMPDMFGVIATPNAMFSIQRILLDHAAVKSMPAGGVKLMGLSYRVPLKTGKTLETHVADWTSSARIRLRDASTDIEHWFFGVLQDCLVSPDVEAKYRNSLEFLRHCEVLRAASYRNHAQSRVACLDARDYRPKQKPKN